MSSSICASYDGKCLYPGFEVQLCGMILKKMGKGKWKKKFCAIRDGFFLVFRDDAFSSTARNSAIPFSALEGFVPLSRAKVEPCGDNENPFCFRVCSNEILEDFEFSANHPQVMSRWMDAFMAGRSVNFEKLGEWEAITTFQEENAKVTQENLRYREMCKQLNERYDELLQMNQFLDSERMELSHNISTLQCELDSMRSELQQMQGDLHSLEGEKSVLNRKNSALEEELLKLDKEKQDAMMSSANALIACGENDNHSRTNQNEDQEVHQRLQDISLKSELLQREKADVMEELQRKETLMHALEEEKKLFEKQAVELSSLLKNVEEQNAEIKRRLDAEMAARKEAEDRLREAEMALGRLQSNICGKGTNYTTDEKKEMTVDVSKLKSFFEKQVSPTAHLLPKAQHLKLQEETRLLASKRDSAMLQLHHNLHRVTHVQDTAASAHSGSSPSSVPGSPFSTSPTGPCP